MYKISIILLLDKYNNTFYVLKENIGAHTLRKNIFILTYILTSDINIRFR